ncbi:hypothetical protein AAFF_G00319530 [Aldrovandia affinis]|uniref:Uncharacterized protein n=1 Tax=Aldrovandia affinis TaxID=143900 RepID=A0AAD7WQN3_9TELE|nr:hypothetical protein AAFF_G00319530 [Aldrovandia affinis]
MLCHPAIADGQTHWDGRWITTANLLFVDSLWGPQGVPVSQERAFSWRAKSRGRACETNDRNNEGAH